jgi:hypothetical protein
MENVPGDQVGAVTKKASRKSPEGLNDYAASQRASPLLILRFRVRICLFLPHGRHNPFSRVPQDPP